MCYNDETKTKTQPFGICRIVIANDVEALAGLLRDREEFYKFVSSWKRVNLDEYIEKIVGEHSITSDNFNVTHNLRKISFWDDGKEYEIVCAMGGKYFRIQRQPYTDSKGNYHGKEYVNFEGIQFDKNDFPVEKPVYIDSIEHQSSLFDDYNLFDVIYGINRYVKLSELLVANTEQKWNDLK